MRWTHEMQIKVLTLWLFLLYAVSCPLSAVFTEELSAYSQAQAAYEARRLEEAFRYAKQAVREEPDHPDAHALLGLLYDLRQDLTKAKEHWEKALKLAPSRADIRQRLEVLKGEAQVEKSLAHSDTYPFVVRFAEGQTPVDLGDLRLLLRESYRIIGQQFDYFPDHPITVILYPEKDFPGVKGISHQVRGLYDGKIRLPLGRSASTSRQLREVLWHEYTHALVHDLSKDRCPLWFNEGIAELQEAQVTAPRLTHFRQAAREGKVIAWQELWKVGHHNVSPIELYYEQSYLIAKYLVKRWKWRGIVGVLKRLGQGYPISDAFQAEYKIDPAVLEKEWLTWVGWEGLL